MESNVWCPRLTAAMILSGSAVHVKGFGSALVSARKRLMAAWRSTTERKTPRFKRRLDSLAKKPSTALSQEHEVGVKWKTVVSTGGSASVSATTRAATSGPSGGMREGRVLSCRRPAMPSFMNRSCQRQTQVFDLPVRRMISLVPTPSALERMIAARQACFCEGVTVPGDRFKSAADGPRDRDGNSGAHAPDSHGNRNREIPMRNFSVRQRPLEQQLAAFSGPKGKPNGSSLKGRKVPPKYRSRSGETWAGRGQRPRWLVAAMKNGKKIESFLIKGR